jgi:uncharacterized surface protein with fasciclin (FAS1) repeats
MEAQAGRGISLHSEILAIYPATLKVSTQEKTMKPHRYVSLFLAVIMLFAVGSVAFAQDADVVDTAAAEDDFSTLVAAMQAAGLVENLKSEGPFTVFVPVNSAFDPLAVDGTLDALLADPSGALTDVLLYHVVPGTVMSSDITDGLEVETLNGESLTFTVTDDGIKVNDANILTADIESSNGVIHSIDSVLTPGDEAEMAEEAEGDMTEDAAEGEEAEGDMAEEAAEGEETEGDMAEEAAEGEETEGDMAEETAIPVNLPATGTGPTSLPLPMLVASALMAVLAAGAVVTRRR